MHLGHKNYVQVLIPTSAACYCDAINYILPHSYPCMYTLSLPNVYFLYTHVYLIAYPMYTPCIHTYTLYSLPNVYPYTLCIPIFTSCIPIYSHVHPMYTSSIPAYTHFYPCIPQFTPCIPLFTHVYHCFPIYTFVHLNTLVYLCILCLPLVFKIHPHICLSE